MLVLKDFLVDEVARRLARYLATEATFQVTYGLYEAADKGGRDVDPGREGTGRRVARAMARSAEPVQVLPVRHRTGEHGRNDAGRRPVRLLPLAFHGPEFRAFLEAVSGTSLGPVSSFCAHSMGSQDMLRPHSDDASERVMAFALYLNPGWKPEYGGALRIRNRGGDPIRIDADHNTFVMFDVTSLPVHEVEPIHEVVGDERRLSISGWIKRPG